MAGARRSGGWGAAAKKRLGLLKHPARSGSGGLRFHVRMAGPTRPLPPISCFRGTVCAELRLSPKGGGIETQFVDVCSRAASAPPCRSLDAHDSSPCTVAMMVVGASLGTVATLSPCGLSGAGDGGSAR